MTGSGSTNTIDQLLGHTDGPSKPIADRDLTRVRSSAYIVHGNFARLDEICDDITTTGLICARESAAKTDVRNEVYRRTHNYLSSLYSYNEQIRTILNDRLSENIHKGYFLPARDNKGSPEYIRRGTFLWGLRNDFQHGDYWCLSIEEQGSMDGQDKYHLLFKKEHFEATAKGNIDSSGDYLAHAPDSDLEYPLPYIGDFHRNLFNEFETAFENWCTRSGP